jgi:hypothetical protein
MISRRTLPLTLLLVLLATILGAAQTATTPLTDEQAQALIQKFQAQPATPLTKAENQNLVKYLIAKNAQQSAAAAQQQAQAAATVRPASAVVPDSAPAPSAADSQKPKATRIGVALPKADLGQGFQGQSAGESLRLLISQYLNSPRIEVVPITALLESQIEAEAKEKTCDYVIYSSMIQKKGGGMGFLKGASSMMSMIPMAGAATGAAGAIAATAAASAAASGAASMAGQVKAKNDVTFEYHMFAPGNATPVLENKTTAKAKTDGEDVITPLVESAATSIVAKVIPKS